MDTLLSPMVAASANRSMPLGVVAASLHLPGPPQDLNSLAGRSFERRNWLLTLALLGERGTPRATPSAEEFSQDEMMRLSIGGHDPTTPFLDAADVQSFMNDTGLTSFYEADAQSCTDLAVTAAVDVCKTIRADRRERLTHIIYCTATPEERPMLFPALGIHHALGASPRVLPFAVTQVGSVASYRALLVARHLLSAQAVSDILLVCCDRHIPPISRRFGNLTVASDAAAAFWLTSDGTADWAIVDVALARLHKAPRFEEIDIPNPFLVEAADLLRDLILRLLATHGLSVRDLGDIIPCGFSPRLAGIVQDALCVMPGADPARWATASANLGNSDFGAALRHLAAIPAADSRPVLTWSVGLSGAAACALLTRRNGS
jgi:hypothetical protein